MQLLTTIKYAKWYSESEAEGVVEAAKELCLSTISMAGTAFSAGEPAHAMLLEMPSSPFSEAIRSLGMLVNNNPSHFVSQASITALGGECPMVLSIVFTTSDDTAQSLGSRLMSQATQQRHFHLRIDKLWEPPSAKF